MSGRYSRYLHIQPIRKISLSVQDVWHTVKTTERVDQLAGKYYNDPTLAWIIMCANPDFSHEFDVKEGSVLRIPMPLSRIYREWGLEAEL